MTRSGAILVCLLALGAGAGCQKAEREPAPPVTVCPEVDAGTIVDPALLAFLSRARAAHHLADAAEEKQDLTQAVSVLREFLRGKTPPNRPEAEEVLADTHARIAELQSKLGRFEEASASVERGMQFAKGTTYYLGHLFEIKGLVAERRAKQLREQGDERAAQAAEKSAIEAFERSMSIQEKVLDELLKPNEERPQP